MKGVALFGQSKLEAGGFSRPSADRGKSCSRSKPRACAAPTCIFIGHRVAERRWVFKSPLPSSAATNRAELIAAVRPWRQRFGGQNGARMMVHHYSGCGLCSHCRTGWTQMCVEGSVVYGVTAHGGHARYMKIPASTLVPLPDGLSFETGAAISCGTGTAYGALRRLNLSGRDTIAIFGQGPVGLSATQFAVAMGARVIASDIGLERLALAKRYGADVTINAAGDDPLGAIEGSDPWAGS